MISKLICLGDSLTEAYGINPENGWTHLLSQQVDYPVINEGISGDTTAGMLARFHSEVKRQEPSHLILMGGTNDISLNIPIETILGNVLAISRHAKRINCQLIVGIPPSSYFEDENFESNVFLGPKNFKVKLNELQTALRNFAIEDDLPFIDFSNLLKKEDFLEDGTHPNKSGHLAMKYHVFKVLESLYLNKN